MSSNMQLLIVISILVFVYVILPIIVSWLSAPESKSNFEPDKDVHLNAFDEINNIISIFVDLDKK